MRDVPRHQFVPERASTDAYDDIAVITKRADNGAALSCASVPTVVAMMLDQLDVRPRDRILEIGAGTGYNAALLTSSPVPNGTSPPSTSTPRSPRERAGPSMRTATNTSTVITRDGSLGAEETRAV